MQQMKLLMQIWMTHHFNKGKIMKKALAGFAAFFVVGIVIAQQANCWQQYVCGGGGCQWVTICR
jgi:hypothetical protein